MSDPNDDDRLILQMPYICAHCGFVWGATAFDGVAPRRCPRCGSTKWNGYKRGLDLPRGLHPQLKCSRCGHIWLPSVCPQCGDTRWNIRPIKAIDEIPQKDDG